MPVMDFGDVAARIAAGLSGIRACLVVSRDGLSLGAYPADGEARAREVWDVLEQLGDVKRGFVEMGLDLWVIARRGPYGGVVVASPDVRPGLVLDRIEANLYAAEQERSRQATDEPPPPLRPEPVRRPRSPLHPEPRLEMDQGPSDEAPSPAEPEASETTEATADETVAPAAPVVDLSRVPDAEPATESEESVPEPPSPPAPVPPAPEPVGEPAAQAFAEAMESEPAAAPEQLERVPTFTPASTPEPEAGEVYMAGVAPEEALPPEPVPLPEAPPAAEEPPKKKRRFRKKSGEVDRVALAREFGHLMRDEFGV